MVGLLSCRDGKYLSLSGAIVAKGGGGLTRPVKIDWMQQIDSDIIP